MGITWFATEEEFDAEAERLEDLQMEHMELKQDVEYRREELETAEVALQDFLEENKEFLVGG